MMEFKDTTLPHEPDVFRAFMAYAKNAGKNKFDHHPVLTAELLNQMMPYDTEAVTQALLNYMPDAALPVIKKQFGENRADIVAEAGRHMRTQYAYLDEASPSVKAFATASAIAHLMEFDAGVEDLYRTMAGFKRAGSRANPDLDAPYIPNPRVLDQIAKAANGQTGSEALDWMLIEKIENYRMEAEEKLATVGMDAPPDIEFANFEDSGLMQDPKVQGAYEELVYNSHANPINIAQALGAARLLGNMPETQNPTTIAAALIDIGLGNRNEDDMHFLQNRLDWDVMELVSNYNVRQVKSAEEIATAPIEFRQLAMAYAVVTLDASTMQGKMALAQLKKDEDKMPEGIANILRENVLAQLNGALSIAARVMESTAKTVEAPVLQGLFRKKLKTLQDFVADSTPKKMLMLPAPAPKPVDPAKDGFDF